MRISIFILLIGLTLLIDYMLDYDSSFILFIKPLHKFIQLTIILNYCKGSHPSYLLWTLNILIILYLFENIISIDDMVTFSLQILPDNFA